MINALCTMVVPTPTTKIYTVPVTVRTDDVPDYMYSTLLSYKAKRCNAKYSAYYPRYASVFARLLSLADETILQIRNWRNPPALTGRLRVTLTL
jgi:hypothetical protein